MAVRIFKHDKDGPVVKTGYAEEIRGTFEVSYEGAVLDTRERNGYDDSDFYAVVWDEAEGRVKNVEYASTRGWTYLNSAAVDATEEVKAKAAAYYRTLALAALKDRAAAEARKPAVGKAVKVVKGRKVPKGTEGVVIWVGPGRAYSYYAAKYGVPDRVGLKTADGTVYWTSASNVEVTDPEEWLPDLDELERRADSAGYGSYLAAGVAPGWAVL